MFNNERLRDLEERVARLTTAVNALCDYVYPRGYERGFDDLARCMTVSEMRVAVQLLAKELGVKFEEKHEYSRIELSKQDE